MTRPAVRQSQSDTQIATRSAAEIFRLLDSDESASAIRRALDADPGKVIAAAKAFIRTAERPEAILACEPRSIVLACVDAARVGLLPDGVDGYLIPRKGKAKFMASWRGMVTLIRRANEIVAFHANVVYENEIRKGAFLVEEGLQRTLRHKPYYMVGLTRENRGPIVAAYCTWEVEGRKPDFHVVDRDRLEDAKRASGDPREEKPSDVWVKYERAMARKTAIRDAIASREIALPDVVMETLARALEHDVEREDGPTITVAPQHAAPTGDARTGRGMTAEQIRARAPRRTEQAPIDVAASEPASDREPGDDDVEAEGGAQEAP